MPQQYQGVVQLLYKSLSKNTISSHARTGQRMPQTCERVLKKKSQKMPHSSISKKYFRKKIYK